MALKIFIVTAGTDGKMEPVVATYSSEDATMINEDFISDGLDSKIFSVGLISKTNSESFRKVYADSKQSNGGKLK